MKRQHFTLIEVLIAGIIISTVILLVAQAQKQNSLVLQKIQGQQQKQEAFLFIRKIIETNIEQGEKQQQGKWDQWHYSWNASKQTNAKTRKNPILPVSILKTVNLYKVSLTIRKNNLQYTSHFFKTAP